MADMEILNPGTEVAFPKDGAALEAVLTEIKSRYRAVDETLTVETAAGRKAIISRAYEVTKTKTALDKAGAALVEEARQTVKRVDGMRKTIRDELDALKDEVRRPVDEWEAAEEARKGAIRARVVEVYALGTMEPGAGSEAIKARAAELAAIEITDEAFGEFRFEALEAKEKAGHKLHAAFREALEREAAEKEAARQREEQERELARLREEEAKRKAEDEARAKAEAERQAEIEALRRQAAEAEARAAAAERARVEAEEREKREAEAKAAREREESERVAREAREAAIREADEKAAAEWAEAERKAAEKAEKKAAAEREKRRGAAQREAEVALRNLTGIDAKTAGAVLDAIAVGGVPHVRFAVEV